MLGIRDRCQCFVEDRQEQRIIIAYGNGEAKTHITVTGDPNRFEMVFVDVERRNRKSRDRGICSTISNHLKRFEDIIGFDNVNGRIEFLKLCDQC